MSKSYSKTISKALKILENFAGENNYKSLAELEKEVGLNKSSLCRLLKTLELSDFVEQDKKAKSYKLGKKILILGLSIINNLDIRKEALPFMKKLNDFFGETVNLGILYNDNILYLEILKGRGYVHEAATIGGQDPLYSTSLGKIFLASFNEDKLNKYLESHKLIKKTDNTIKDKEELKNNLKDVRKNGYTTDNGENEKGLVCYGVPIKNYQNETIAAISISFLNVSVETKKIKEIIKSLMEVSKNLSERFGYYSRDMKKILYPTMI